MVVTILEVQPRPIQDSTAIRRTISTQRLDLRSKAAQEKRCASTLQKIWMMVNVNSWKSKLHAYRLLAWRKRSNSIRTSFRSRWRSTLITARSIRSHIFKQDRLWSKTTSFQEKIWTTMSSQISCMTCWGSRKVTLGKLRCRTMRLLPCLRLKRSSFLQMLFISIINITWWSKPGKRLVSIANCLKSAKQPACRS